MLTFKSIAEGIEPKWTLNHWFQWPPNAFALISIILGRTGCYKICLQENAWWEDRNYSAFVEEDAEIWVKAANIGLRKEKLSFTLGKFYLLDKYYKILNDDWNGTTSPVNINDLRTIDYDNIKEIDPEKFQLQEIAKALVTLLAIADACCAGLGFISPTIAQDEIDANLFKPIANLLLTTTGSLSTLPKFHGTVLPKMRTPQSGIVLRSLSHHLTFHCTEVEVIWRTFPWLNDDKQSLNLLVVPYPNKVYKTDFEVVEENYHSVRYFKGKIQEHIDIEYLNALVNQVCSNASTNNVVDLLVFPEMALSERQYNYLLNKFSESYNKFPEYKLENNNGVKCYSQLPIIISGVLHESVHDPTSNSVQPMHNEVRMAVFFAGRWYDITQRKHHRWQLDRNQIVQYGLEGYFPTDRKWFELCSILQRRLTILAPNGWLALTALICEDLARQEPVAEVIRGIGPTLLMALLSDGPQLTTRWSARYASVLADDPGTAVLSITSKGMAKRAKNPNSQSSEAATSYTVGLWKDMIRGWKELKLDSANHLLMFTISAKMDEEYTLDGRSDGSNSSVFRMDSINPKQIALVLDENIKKHEELKELNEDEKTYILKMTQSSDFGNWHEIRGLSAIVFSIDAIVDLLTINPDGKYLNSSIDAVLNLLEKREKAKENNLFTEIKLVISESWGEPNKVGTAAIKLDNSIVPIGLEKEVVEIKALIDAVQTRRKSANSSNWFQFLIDECEQRIINDLSSGNKFTNTIPIAFLYNVNTKLSSFKTPYQLHHDNSKEPGLTPMDAMKFTERIRAILNRISTNKVCDV